MNQMPQTGLWKPWKNKMRFPTVPTASTPNHLHKIFDTAGSAEVPVRTRVECWFQFFYSIRQSNNLCCQTFHSTR